MKNIYKPAQLKVIELDGGVDTLQFSSETDDVYGDDPYGSKTTQTYFEG